MPEIEQRDEALQRFAHDGHEYGPWYELGEGIIRRVRRNMTHTHIERLTRVQP